MGKKRQFNENQVLEQIASHFWKHGYSATKVDQLSTLTGLTKTSLYNAFGNKEALFSYAIELYVDSSLKDLYKNLDLENKLSQNLEYIFDKNFNKKNNPKLDYGCLLTNSIVELNGNEKVLHNYVTKLCAKVRAETVKLFSHYVENKRVSPNYNAEELTDLYMTFWQGLRVQSRNHSPAEKLKNSTDSFLKFINSIEYN